MKETNWNQWYNLTSDKTNLKNAVSFLSKVEDFQFPDLVKNRNATEEYNGTGWSTSGNYPA